MRGGPGSLAVCIPDELEQNIRVLADYETLSSALATGTLQVARESVLQRGRFLLALNGGGTPQRLFELFGQNPHKVNPIWQFTELFWGDERCVPPNMPGSSYRQAVDAFVKNIDIPAHHVHRIKGELPPEIAAQEYAEVIENYIDDDNPWPKFDLIYLGIGTDGHTASLFPGSPQTGDDVGVIAVKAEYQDRPADRISLTPAVFNAGRKVFIMASGSSKAEIVRRVLMEEVDPSEVPVMRINPEIVTWWLDAEAASRL